MELISIIVPIYKVEKYLCECIDSVLAQTYENFELILVDDGSPDNCGKICDEYAKKDSRIKVFHKENGGVSSARNVGLDNAKGEYITFIDSDDFVDKQYLERLYVDLKENGADVSICKISCYNEGATYLKRDVFPGKAVITENKKEFENFICRYFSLKKYIMGSACRSLYKKYILEKHRFDESLKICEDLLFLIGAFCQTKKISFIKSPLYYYRVNEESALHTYKKNYLENHIALYSALDKILSKKNSKKINKALENYRSLLCYYVVVEELVYKSGCERKENLKNIKNHKFYKNFKLFNGLKTVRIRTYPRFFVIWARIKFNLY